jgi:hypothetical protein
MSRGGLCGMVEQATGVQRLFVSIARASFECCNSSFENIGEFKMKYDVEWSKIGFRTAWN